MSSIYAPWLANAAYAAAYGTAMHVYEQPGWQNRGHGGMTMLEGVVGHHTGTPASSPGDFPTLGTILNGRSDLPGPLAAYGLGRGGHIYVVAAGLSYHAGESAYAGFTSLNGKFLGIEAESPGDGTWTAEQLFMYPRLVGEILRAMSRGTDRYCSHRTCATPAGRKPDPTGISDTWMRDQVAAYYAPAPVAPTKTPTAEEDMIITSGTGSSSKCGILSGGVLLDITTDSTARGSAQAAINKGTTAEVTVSAATWDGLPRPAASV
jgi:hypothetical protein